MNKVADFSDTLAEGADVLHGLRHGKGGIRTALRIEDSVYWT